MESDRPMPEDGENAYEDEGFDEEAYDEPDEFAYRPRAGWGTIIRRVVLVGVLCALVSMAVAWRLIPARYTATAWLRIAEKPPHLLFKAGGFDDFLNDKRASAKLITSNFVINAAMRKPGVGQLSSIRDQRDPVEWMTENVTVSFPGDSEIIQIAMTGDDPSELVTLVNAVMNAYMEEVVAVDREESLRRKRLLEQSYQRIMQQIAEEQTEYDDLADKIGVVDSDRARRERAHALDALPDLRARVNAVRDQIAILDRAIRLDEARLAKLDGEGESAVPAASGDAAVLRRAEAILAEDHRIELATRQIGLLQAELLEESLRTDAETPSRAADLEARIGTLRAYAEKRRQELLPQVMEQARRHVIAVSSHGPASLRERIAARIQDAKAEKAALEEQRSTTMLEFRQAAREAEEAVETSPELEAKQAELDRLKQTAAEIGEHVEQREIELAAPERVKVLEKANVSKEPDVGKKVRGVLWSGVFVFLAVCLVGFAVVFRTRMNRPPAQWAFHAGESTDVPDAERPPYEDHQH